MVACVQLIGSGPGERGHLAIFALYSWLLIHSEVGSWLLWEYSKGALLPPKMLVNSLQARIFVACLHPEVCSWSRNLCICNDIS